MLLELMQKKVQEKKLAIQKQNTQAHIHAQIDIK